jgi:hypothetical protein
LETAVTVLIFVITVSLSAKSLVIFHFIFELLALRVKLEAGQFSDYLQLMQGLNLKKRVVMITFGTIDGVFLVMIAINST